VPPVAQTLVCARSSQVEFFRDAARIALSLETGRRRMSSSFFQILVLIRFQHLRNIRMHAQHAIFSIHDVARACEPPADLSYYSLHRSLTYPAPSQCGQGMHYARSKLCFHALSSNRHQPRNRLNCRILLGASIRPHCVFERLHHLLAILALIHVDEIHQMMRPSRANGSGGQFSFHCLTWFGFPRWRLPGRVGPPHRTCRCSRRSRTRTIV